MRTLKPQLLLPSGLGQHIKNKWMVLLVGEMMLVKATTTVVMEIVATVMRIDAVVEIAIVPIATRRRGRRPLFSGGGELG